MVRAERKSFANRVFSIFHNILNIFFRSGFVAFSNISACCEHRFQAFVVMVRDFAEYVWTLGVTDMKSGHV